MRFSWKRAFAKAAIWGLGMFVWFVLIEHFEAQPRTPFVQSLAQASWLFVPILLFMAVLFGISLEALLCWLERRTARKDKRKAD